jgi:hypothetical protein
MYMSIFSMIGSLAAGFGALAAGLFLNAAGAWSISLLGLLVTAFPVLFVASTLLRFATLFTLLPRVRTTSAAREERTFLLPLFFEGLPGIQRFRRQPPSDGRPR